MPDAGTIKTFVDSMGYDEKYKSSLDMQKGHFPFITISRETGAGGHTLAKALLERMRAEKGLPIFQGWQLCDQEVCQCVAEDKEINVSLQSLLSSEYRSEIEEIVTELMTGASSQDKIVKKIFEIIRTLASYGKVILVEHGSTFVTRELHYGIHVRLVASMPSKIKRMQKLLGISEAEAKSTIKQQDKGRARLVSTFFNQKIDDPLHYDVIWNTDTVSIDAIAQALMIMIKQKAAGKISPAPSKIRP